MWLFKLWARGLNGWSDSLQGTEEPRILLRIDPKKTLRNKNENRRNLEAMEVLSGFFFGYVATVGLFTFIHKRKSRDILTLTNHHPGVSVQLGRKRTHHVLPARVLLLLRPRIFFFSQIFWPAVVAMRGYSCAEILLIAIHFTLEKSRALRKSGSVFGVLCHTSSSASLMGRKK